MSLNISLRPSGSTWTEALAHAIDMAVERLDQAVRSTIKDLRGDFRRDIHAMRVRRLTAHGGSSQSLL